MRIILTQLSLPYAIRQITEAADGQHQIELGPLKKDKTHEQRKLFHAKCKDIGDELGYTQREIKEMVKADYFGVDTVVIEGKSYQMLKSSEALDRMDYSKLCDYLMQWAAERGIG